MPRVVIENVRPCINCGQFPAKRVLGEVLQVSADIFADGHTHLDADLLIKKRGDSEWKIIPMRTIGNDCWEASFQLKEVGMYFFTIQAWINPFQSWRHDFLKKVAAKQDVSIDKQIGEELIGKAILSDDLEKFLEYIESSDLHHVMREKREKVTRYEQELALECLPKKTLFSTWYECFPRSCGGFLECVNFLPKIADMGFDVLYLPPIHPIGRINRKGKNNQTAAEEGDPGCPWAIASHDTIDPDLGTMHDFHVLVKEAKECGIDIALDIAFQCAPDHPYVKEHPNWFKWRPDGTVQHAENPPKKYEDVLPFDFDTEDWEALWEECKRIVFFWMEQGVGIFRVDNPHTKPFIFWEWLIKEVKAVNQNVIFLSEAFTRPKVMQRLAKAGFDQSYTYFSWRNTKGELEAYMKELTATNKRNYFIPNFWPNTPDILPQFLQVGTKEAFEIRLVLAATLSSNYGIYGPPFENLIAEAIPGREEYLHSEKYEIKNWGEKKAPLFEEIKWINAIRKENPALQTPWNLLFCETNQEDLIAYFKYSDDLKNILLIVVSLNPQKPQSGSVKLNKMPLTYPLFAENLLTGEKAIWEEEKIEVCVRTAAIYRIQSMRSKEKDFDYYG